jgi:predicted PurR-regulated permease PerM
MTVAQSRARAVLAAAFVASALLLAHGLLPALVWAAVVAIGLDPLRRRLAVSLPGRPGLVAAILTAVCAVTIVVPLAVMAGRAAGEMGDLATWIQNARVNGVAVPAWVGALPYGTTRVSDWWTVHLSDPAAFSREVSRLDPAAVIHRGRAIGLELIARAIRLGITLIALFFILRDADAIVDQARIAADRAFGEAGPRIGSQVLRSIRGTIDGIVLAGLAQGALMGVVYLTLGVTHPVLFAFAAAIGAMVPLGLLVAVAAPALLLLLGGSTGAAAAVLAIAFLMHFVAEHFAKPALIGGATRLPFLWVLLGLIGGLETIGLLGLFIGPSVMAVVVTMWREYVHPVESTAG